MSEAEEWALLGPLKEKYCIGSEGGSAWCWIGDDPNNMNSIGATGKTEREAIKKLLRKLGCKSISVC